MKFNVVKLRAIARPMTPEEQAALDLRSENADWLRLSAAIALKIRKILRNKVMSQGELANLLSVTPAQLSKLLSGKINFELKTIAKLQTALGESIVEINLSDNQIHRAEQQFKTQVVVVPQFVKGKTIVSNQRVGVESYFSGYKIVG